MKIQIGQVISQIIAFLLMLWILSRYAWKPILNTMEERRHKIQSDSDAIEDQRKQAEALLAEYRAKLGEIETTAQTKFREVINAAKAESEKIQNEAHQHARGILAKAQSDMQKEVQLARVQMKNELVGISLAAAEKILKSEMDKEKQKKLLSDIIEQVEAP
ncbi:MAG: F0F1 ATP synthase subunit B [Parachlamydiaceae bacterium]